MLPSGKRCVTRLTRARLRAIPKLDDCHLQLDDGRRVSRKCRVGMQPLCIACRNSKLWGAAHASDVRSRSEHGKQKLTGMANSHSPSLIQLGRASSSAMVSIDVTKHL